MTNIGIACFNYYGGRSLLYAPAPNASWLKETSDIRELFGELITFKPNDFVLLLSPCSTGMQIIISKMIMSHYGDNLSVYLHLPFGIDIDGKTLNSIIEEIISAIKLNSKDGIINCLNTIFQKQFPILDEQEDIEYKTSEKLAYRHLKSDDLFKIFGNVFQSYYYDYKYIFLALDGQTVANIENKQDLTYKPLISNNKKTDIGDNNSDNEAEPDSHKSSSEHTNINDTEKSEYTSAWLKKNTTIRGWLLFFLCTILFSGIIKGINTFTSFNAQDYAGIFCLEATDLFSGLAFAGLALYTVCLFFNRKPNAVFFYKAYVIIVFLTTLLQMRNIQEENPEIQNMPISETISYYVGYVLGIVLVCGIWLSFIINSNQVKKVIPKTFRTVSKIDIGIIAGIIIIPVLLFTIGRIQIRSISNSYDSLETEMNEIVLADNERTDGRVIFTIPEDFTCEKKVVSADGAEIAVFILKNNKIGSCSMCSNYDINISDENFDDYWTNSKVEEAYNYTEYDVNRGTITINDNLCKFKITKYNVNGIYLYWRFYLMFDSESEKVLLASFLDRNISTEYVDELLNSVRFQ